MNFTYLWGESFEYSTRLPPRGEGEDVGAGEASGRVLDRRQFRRGRFLEVCWSLGLGMVSFVRSGDPWLFSGPGIGGDGRRGAGVALGWCVWTADWLLLSPTRRVLSRCSLCGAGCRRGRGRCRRCRRGEIQFLRHSHVAF